LYSPSRLNEAVSAVQQGERALQLYQELGSRPGEAQARFCLVDTLRMGERTGREESRAHAASAAKVLDDLGFEYQPARAQYYIALASAATGDMPGTLAAFERSLELARKSGNAELEPLLLMNLGVASVALGNTVRAAGFYQESVERYRALRNESRAAQILANRGAMLIEQGPQPAEGLRDVQNALKMFQALGDTNFEVFCLQVTAAYYRHMGDHQGAERELNKALTIARGRNLADEIGSLAIDIARSRFEMADYEAARDRLLRAVGDGSSPSSAEARVWLARVHTRRGQFDAADMELRAAEADARASIEGPLRMLLEIARGDLAYERGSPGDADAHFARVVGEQAEGASDELAIEARAALGLLEGERGRHATAEALLRGALDDARRLNLVGLERRCLVYLARMAVDTMRFRQAIVMLEDVPGDASVGPETRMQAHFWRGRAMLGAGSGAEAERELAAARAIAGTLRDQIPAAGRAGFVTRPAVRLALGTQNVRS
jgi:tetratricopeptide (TPR) repeat protein